MTSKRHLRKRQCGKKQRHESESKAIAHAVAAGRYYGAEMNVYKCRWCKRWHIGRKKRYIGRNRRW